MNKAMDMKHAIEVVLELAANGHAEYEGCTSEERDREEIEAMETVRIHYFGIPEEYRKKG